MLCSSTLWADDISLSSDLWCPYACESNSSSPGFMVEIAKVILEGEGHKVNYTTINWARAVSETKTGKFAGIIGASRADVVGFVLPSVPTGFNSNYFWVIKDNNWSYKDVKSLSGKKIGLINSYSYGNEIDNEVQKKNPNYIIVSGNDALKKLIRMTDIKRLDGFVENPNVLNYLLKDMPEFKNHFKIVSKNVANDPDLFVAFSPSNPNSKKYAQLISDGMSNLRKSGKLKTILSKYGVSDWK